MEDVKTSVRCRNAGQGVVGREGVVHGCSSDGWSSPSLSSGAGVGGSAWASPPASGSVGARSRPWVGSEQALVIKRVSKISFMDVLRTLWHRQLRSTCC